MLSAQAAFPVSRGTEAAAASSGRAIRAVRPPVLDGSDDDAVWKEAQVLDQFREFEPSEDGDPSMRTEVRVAFDERSLYVFVRAHDPHPDSILSLLSRRDVKTTSDQIKIIIDGYHDRLTGVEMSVNPVGVKRDASIYSDWIEDLSWDGVWDAATRIDSLGWTAEFRVPFSQLRFGSGDSHTFGFGVWRDIARRNERVSWPVYRKSRQALASQLGTLEGITNVRRSSRLEVLPYALTKNVTELRANGWSHPQQASAGLDLKYGVTESVTLDATVNPDFGQVEADPAVLNLTAFEVRFEERRPFFLEGVGLYKCRPCQGLFYSRRIGRSPQLGAPGEDAVSTTILGAAKLTGRLNSGLNLGLIDAVTQRELGADGRTIEPQTNYFVGRLLKEMRQGRSSLGALVTMTNRALDAGTEPYLRRAAYAGSVEGSHRFGKDRYEIMGYAGGSRVLGSAAAMARTQLGTVHLFQRPDDRYEFDSTQTSMDGSVTSLVLSKISGIVRGELWLRRATPGLEVNDAGLVANTNDQQIRQTVSLQSRRPHAFFRQSYNQLDVETHWSVDGLPSANALQLHTSFELLNSWGTALTYQVQNPLLAYCITCARGGPALRQSPRHRLQFNLTGDKRRVVVPTMTATLARGDEGRSRAGAGLGGFDLRVASRFAMSLGVNAEKKIDDQQWTGNFGDPLSDTTHYTFARLDQTTVGLTGRMSWTATPRLSLQLYAEPFVSAGSYSNWRELNRPRAAAYDARFTPAAAGSAPPDFNFKQFNSNLVLRWEYRPGSTFFAVWQQGRLQQGLNPGSFEFSRDYRDLFGAHPGNTLLLKVSWWTNI